MWSCRCAAQRLRPEKLSRTYGDAEAPGQRYSAPRSARWEPRGEVRRTRVWGQLLTAAAATSTMTELFTTCSAIGAHRFPWKRNSMQQASPSTNT